MSVTSDNIRKSFKESDDRRDAGLTTPENVERYDDIAYGDDAVSQSLDVYRPKGIDGKLPVIVSVHGGGWVYGDKERYQYYCMSLVQHGFAVVNFTYRLAPEHKFPAAIEDINAVFKFVLENNEKYGFDTEHIFAVGDSAGAHQLGLYAVICTNPEYAKRFDFAPPKGFAPTAVALNCGFYSGDAANMSAELRKEMVPMMGEYLPNGGSANELEMIDVVKHITEDFPPTLYMTSSHDFLKEQAPILGKKLLECNVPHVFRFYGSAKKPLYHVFHCDMRLKEAYECNRDECEYFRSFLPH